MYFMRTPPLGKSNGACPNRQPGEKYSPSHVGSVWHRNQAARHRGSAQFTQPALEKSPLRFLPRQLESPLVGCPCIRASPQPPAEVRPRRMGEVVVRQVAA